MKEEFVRYLQIIDLTNTIITQRIKPIYDFYSEIDEISDVFVSDYLTIEGIREYESLWLFSAKYLMEARDFIIKDDFDIVPIRNKIIYFRIQKQDYDFKNATERSRLNLLCSLGVDLDAELKASKKNCDYLKDIFFKYITPNLKE